MLSILVSMYYVVIWFVCLIACFNSLRQTERMALYMSLQSERLRSEKNTSKLFETRPATVSKLAETLNDTVHKFAKKCLNIGNVVTTLLGKDEQRAESGRANSIRSVGMWYGPNSLETIDRGRLFTKFIASLIDRL
jgi:hypothetical protein